MAIIDLPQATNCERLAHNVNKDYRTIAGSSNDVFITPATFRAGINAENEAPIYACRAWCVFDGTTTSSSISGTYTRVVGTTETVMVATGHGYITGNVANVDFTSGGASDNSYIVTVTDEDTFIVNTVSTSSILTSAFTLRRALKLAGGNVGSISFATAGTFYINFSTELPSEYYTWSYSGSRPSGVSIGVQDYDIPPTKYSLYIQSVNIAELAGAHERCNLAVFA